MDDFKNRNKRHDAWAELDQILSVESGESEKKMRKLVSQFQRESKKILKSGKGAGEDGKWTYFKCLMFLKNKNKPRTTLDGGFSGDERSTEDVDGDESQVTDLNQSIDEEGDTSLDLPRSNNVFVTATKPCSARPRAAKRKYNAMAEEAYSVMKRFQNKEPRDEFDSYGETVAMTLRKLSKISASYAKFEINKVLFSAEMGHYKPPTRPGSTSSYSSLHSNTSAVVPPPMQSPATNPPSIENDIFGQDLEHSYPSRQEPASGVEDDDNANINTLLTQQTHFLVVGHKLYTPLCTNKYNI